MSNATRLLLVFVLSSCARAQSAPARTIKLSRVLKHDVGVNALTFSPDGKTLVCGESNGQLQQWNLSSGQKKTIWKGKQGRTISALSFSPDGRLLAIGVGGDVAVWDVRKHHLKWMRQEDDTDQINSLAFSPDNKMLASAHVQWRGEGESGKFKVWAANTGRVKHTQSYADEDVSSVVFTPDGRTLIANQSSVVSFWNVRNWHLKRHLEVEGNLSEPALALSKSGRVLAVGSFNNSYVTQILIWDLKTHKLSRRLEKQSLIGGATNAALSPNAKILLIAGASWIVPVEPKQIAVWDLQTNKVRQILIGMKLVAFSPDGKTIATGTEDREKRAGMKPGRIVRLWRMN